MIKVSVRVPSTMGEARKPGTASTVNSGTCFFSASWLRGFRNMVRANRLCHAFCVMMRTGKEYSGSAPA